MFIFCRALLGIFRADRKFTDEFNGGSLDKWYETFTDFLLDKFQEGIDNY